MKKILILLFAMFTVMAEDLPKPEVEKPKVVEVEAELNPTVFLSPDEIEFVKNQFKTAVIQGAQYQCVQPELGADGKAYVSINHPKDNPVVKLVCTKIWKTHQDMVGEIYDNVYREADKKNGNLGFRIWDYNGELTYVGNKILAKINEDNEFYLELIKVVKKVLKK